MERIELVATALQQRIGEIVASYETQIAVLRAEITKMKEEQDKDKAKDDYIKSIVTGDING